MQPPSPPSMPLNVADLIRRKRDGEALSAAELTDLIAGYTWGDVPDDQMAAWLMAVSGVA